MSNAQQCGLRGPDSQSDIHRLRQYVADLEAENALLRGAGPCPETAPHGATPPGDGRADGEYLTVEQAARELNVATWQVLRELRDSLPLSVDDAGRAVVACGDVDAFLSARAQGRATQRFL